MEISLNFRIDDVIETSEDDEEEQISKILSSYKEKEK